VSDRGCSLCGTPRLTRQVNRQWRVVHEDSGGISFSTSERTHPRDAKERAEAWAEALRRYGRRVRVEVWEQAWWTTESEWRRLPEEET
jgi:hypothetical protein